MGKSPLELNLSIIEMINKRSIAVASKTCSQIDLILQRLEIQSKRSELGLLKFNLKPRNSIEIKIW